MKKVFFLLLSISLLSAAEVRYDCLRFVERGMSHDPMLAESKFSIEEKKLKEDAATFENLEEFFNLIYSKIPFITVNQILYTLDWLYLLDLIDLLNGEIIRCD